MSKTEDVINMLEEGKSTSEIKDATGASESLISRCRKRLANNTEPEEEEVSDEEIDGFIRKIKIKPEEKHLTGNNQVEPEEYTCGNCDYSWSSKREPRFCPNCGCEFE